MEPDEYNLDLADDVRRLLIDATILIGASGRESSPNTTPVQVINGLRGLIVRSRCDWARFVPPVAAVGDPPSDLVDHPAYYNAHPAGIECIDVIEWFPCNIANAIKYEWRAGLKGDAIEDLKKARWYIDREISRLERMGK